MQKTLTTKEAYAAMYAYLVELYERTHSDDLGGFLGGMSLLSDGKTADPAAWPDWEEAIRKATSGELDMELRLRRTDEER